MESLALRLVLPALVVIVASLVQRHLGDRLGGLIVGLPLTSGTFLGLVLHAHGPTAVTEAAVGMLAGQVAVIAMALSYARFVRAGVSVALGGAILCWGVTVVTVRPVDEPLVGLALVGLIAPLALCTWPAAPALDPATPSTSGAGGFTLRVVCASALVVTLTSTVHVLGAHVAGLLSAAPLVALVLTPVTHRDRGGAAASALLHGVAKGAVGAATFALVLVVGAEGLGGLAFLAAASAGITVTGLVSVVPQPTTLVTAAAVPHTADPHSSAPGTQLVADPAQVLHQ